MKHVLVFMAGLGVVAALAVAVPLASAAPPKLVGTVGPGYTISLTKGGKKVKTLKPGKYTFVINDRASIHNFNLDGPNEFEKVFTSVSFTGTKKVTLNLKKGKYKFYCKPHESLMFGRFVVK